MCALGDLDAYGHILEELNRKKEFELMNEFQKESIELVIKYKRYEENKNNTRERTSTS